MLLCLIDFVFSYREFAKRFDSAFAQRVELEERLLKENAEIALRVSELRVLVETEFVRVRDSIIHSRFTGRNLFWNDDSTRVIDRLQMKEEPPKLQALIGNQQAHPVDVSVPRPSCEDEWMALLRKSNEDLEDLLARLEASKKKGDWAVESMTSAVSTLRKRWHELQEHQNIVSTWCDACSRLMTSMAELDAKIQELLKARESLRLDAEYYVQRARDGLLVDVAARASV